MEAGFNLNARCIACSPFANLVLLLSLDMFEGLQLRDRVCLRSVGLFRAPIGSSASSHWNGCASTIMPLVHIFEDKVWRLKINWPNGQLIRINWPISPNITVFQVYGDRTRVTPEDDFVIMSFSGRASPFHASVHVSIYYPSHPSRS